MQAPLMKIFSLDKELHCSPSSVADKLCNIFYSALFDFWETNARDRDLSLISKSQVLVSVNEDGVETSHELNHENNYINKN